MRTESSPGLRGSTAWIVGLTLVAIGVVMIVSYLARHKSKSSGNVLSTNPKDLLHAEEAYEMGFKYYRGGGDVLIDHREAFAHFSRAAELGLPEAQAHLSGLLGQKYGLEFRAPDQKLAGRVGKKSVGLRS